MISLFQVTDPYVCVADDECQVIKASLQPHFNHEFYFYNVENRENRRILIEIRDGKDHRFFGSAAVQLKISLKMCSKPKAPLFYEKWFKLADPNNEATANISGEIRMKVIGF